jgi:hypothetical protein
METQRQLDEPDLCGLDPVWTDLRLIEPDLAGFPPGEHIEEAAEGSAVRGPQAVDYLHGPHRCAGLGECRNSRCREPLGSQLAAEGIHPKETLREYAWLLTPALDLSAAKDWANCHATADVIVGDETILRDVPVTYLLWLEHQLTEVLGFFRALQVNDPAKDWVWDPEDQSWRTREPEVRPSVEKGLKSLMLVEPTQYQAGQAQAVPDEHRTGVWKITKFSGAVSRERKARLVENAEALLGALRQARERANHAAAPPVSVGREAFAFLLG